MEETHTHADNVKDKHKSSHDNHIKADNSNMLAELEILVLQGHRKPNIACRQRHHQQQLPLMTGKQLSCITQTH